MSEIIWSDITEQQLKHLNSLDGIFIFVSREISKDRLVQLIKKYLVKANLVIGIVNEPYIFGFENQSQFKTFDIPDNYEMISKVNTSNSPYKITLLRYNQADISHIYSTMSFKRIILINGSWQYSYHLRPEYKILKKRGIDIKFVSPFVNEQEAVNYADRFKPKKINSDKLQTIQGMMQIANTAATNSFDTSFQAGISLGVKQGDKYKLIDYACNTVVPYLTYAWHNGASREKHKSQPGDLSHYDAVHAETMLVMQAQQHKYETKGCTLFINLLPCPNCALMLCKFDFDELVYVRDHSKGYAVDLLTKAGKKITQINDPSQGGY